jgi:hypothetical protein
MYKDFPVYYMNMPQDFERGVRLENRLAQMGFSNVIRVETERNDEKALGVANAQHKALSRGLAEWSGPFIVLEDDVEFFDHPPESIHVPTNADAVYLGVSQWGLRDGRGALGISVKRDNGGLHRVYNMLAAHAILYNSREYVEFLLRGIELFVSIPTNQDKMRAETMKYWNVYASSKPVFYQSGKYEKHTRFILPGIKNRPLSHFYM